MLCVPGYPHSPPPHRLTRAPRGLRCTRAPHLAAPEWCRDGLRPIPAATHPALDPGPLDPGPRVRPPTHHGQPSPPTHHARPAMRNPPRQPTRLTISHAPTTQPLVPTPRRSPPEPLGDGCQVPRQPLDAPARLDTALASTTPPRGQCCRPLSLAASPRSAPGRTAQAFGGACTRFWARRCRSRPRRHGCSDGPAAPGLASRSVPLPRHTGSR